MGVWGRRPQLGPGAEPLALCFRCLGPIPYRHFYASPTIHSWHSSIAERHAGPRSQFSYLCVDPFQVLTNVSFDVLRARWSAGGMFGRRRRYHLPVAP